MNYTKLLLAGMTAVGVTACATPSYNYIPEVKYISKPPLNKETTVSVGDQMLVQGNLSAQDGINLPSAIKFSGISISEGFFPKTGEDEKHEYFSFVSGSGKTSINGLGSVKKGLLQDPVKSLATTKNENKLCVVSAYNLKSCKSDIVFKRDNRTNENLNSFQQTLLYSGRVGSKINISYREFSGNSARPAFNNDVEYDLTEDKSIAYKGAEIDVIDADNRDITFIVRRNFRQPETTP